MAAHFAPASTGGDQRHVFGTLEGSKARVAPLQVKVSFEHHPDYRSHLYLYGTSHDRIPKQWCMRLSSGSTALNDPIYRSFKMRNPTPADQCP